MCIITPCIRHRKTWVHMIHAKFWQFLQGQLKVDEFGETDY